MTSSNGNILRVTGHLCGDFPGPRWVPRTKASDAEPWCFLWSVDLRLNKRLDKQSWGWWFETPSHPLWRHCNVSTFRYALNQNGSGSSTSVFTGSLLGNLVSAIYRRRSGKITSVNRVHTTKSGYLATIAWNTPKKHPQETPPRHARKSSVRGNDACWVQRLICVQTISSSQKGIT